MRSKMCTRSHNDAAERWRRLFGCVVRTTSGGCRKAKSHLTKAAGCLAGDAPDQPSGTTIGNKVAAQLHPDPRGNRNTTRRPRMRWWRYPRQGRSRTAGFRLYLGAFLRAFLEMPESNWQLTDYESVARPIELIPWVVECQRYARYTPCDGSVSAPDGRMENPNR